ncbi:MAG: uracil-DNA glycosylase family protein [Bacteroidota bacterium]
MTLAEKVIHFYTSMDRNWKIAKGFDLIDPFSNMETIEIFSAFYQKYFNDTQRRHFLIGINPGRHGAGVTGVPFTDPKIIAEDCGIANDFPKKNELSAIFVYKFIHAYGGIERFYQKFYINSVCPLGFLRNGINCNYYDDKMLFKSVKKHIVSGLQDQIAMGMHTDVAFCMGNGLNFKFLKKLNEEFSFFDSIVPLPHPRWVMQYRRKRLYEFIELYVGELKKV